MRSYLKIFFIYLVSLTAVSSEVKTPCVGHGGYPYPWEGSGVCTGNLLLSIPLPTANLAIYLNTLYPAGNNGFGNSAWMLTFDGRIYLDNITGNLTVKRYTGQTLLFIPDGAGKWQSSDLQLSRNIVTQDGQNMVEKSAEGTIATYRLFTVGDYRLVSITQPSGQSLTLTRSTSGLITKIQDGFGKYVSVMEEGKVTKITDPAGGEYTFSYDTNGLLTEVTQPDNSSWKINYSSSGQILLLTDPKGNFSQLGYNKLDRLTSVSNSKNYKVEFWFRPASVITNTLNGGSFTKTFEVFDSNGALVKNKYQGPNGKLFTTAEIKRDNSRRPEKFYDYYGNLTQFEWDGRSNLKKLTDPSGIITNLTYGDTQSPDNLVSMKTGEKTITYQYGPYNRLTQINYPGGLTTRYIRETSTGNLTKVIEGNTTVAEYTYEGGLVKTVTDKLGLRSTYSHEQGFLTGFSDAMGRTVSINRNALGLPTDIRSNDGVQKLFEYDPMGRVTLDKVNGLESRSKSVTISRENGGVAAKSKSRKTITAGTGILGTPPPATTTFLEKTTGPVGDYLRTIVKNQDGVTKINDKSVEDCPGCKLLPDKSLIKNLEIITTYIYSENALSASSCKPPPPLVCPWEYSNYPHDSRFADGTAAAIPQYCAYTDSHDDAYYGNDTLPVSRSTTSNWRCDYLTQYYQSPFKDTHDEGHPQLDVRVVDDELRFAPGTTPYCLDGETMLGPSSENFTDANGWTYRAGSVYRSRVCTATGYQ